MERGWKPNVEISPSCPRCGSSNTKFCYYNNYSLTQPRYFCKGCRRYWTKGGSLRNVPVGGGCRKNRRGKSLRLSSDGVQPKNLGYGGLPNDHGRHHAYGKKGISSSESSTSSSMNSDGSDIDLAVVYSNFLNQQQNSKASFDEMPESPRDFDPSLEFTNISNVSFYSTLQLQEENGLAECLTFSPSSTDPRLNEEKDRWMYHCPGLDLTSKNQARAQQCTSQDMSNFGSLPPLPGEEVASQEILWSNPHMNMDSHCLQATQQQEVLQTQDPNMLFGNWSPFDLSSDDTFSRT